MRAPTPGGITASRYSCGCRANSSMHGMLTARTATPSAVRRSQAPSTTSTSDPLLMRISEGLPAGEPSLILMSSGSEGEVVLGGWERLTADGVAEIGRAH